MGTRFKYKDLTKRMLEAIIERTGLLSERITFISRKLETGAAFSACSRAWHEDVPSDRSI